MRFSILSSLALLVFLTACNADQEATEDSSAVTNQSATTDQTVEQEGNTVDELPWTFLVDGIYHNNVTITSGKPRGENPNAGHWIDFKANGAYDYGVWEEKQYSGTWFYDGNTQVLKLTPEGTTARPSEWTVKHMDDNLILIGTSTYGNNATQAQWLRREGFPKQN